MYTYERNGIIIRTMKIEDVSSYIARFNFEDVNFRKEMILKSKKVIKKLKDDSPDMYFTVIKNGMIIGAIVAKAFIDLITDAAVEIDIPNAGIKQIREMKKHFVEFARETYIYDDIYFVNQNKSLGKKIPISDSSRWKTPN